MKLVGERLCSLFSNIEVRNFSVFSMQPNPDPVNIPSNWVLSSSFTQLKADVSAHFNSVPIRLDVAGERNCLKSGQMNRQCL